MFLSHSDHPQGARIFLIKVTDFNICPAYLSTQSAGTHTIYYAAASPHCLFTFLTNFRISTLMRNIRAP